MSALSVLVTLPVGPLRESFLKILRAFVPDARVKLVAETAAMRALANERFDVIVAQSRPGHQSSDLLVLASRNAPLSARILVTRRASGLGANTHAHAAIVPPFGNSTARALAGVLGLVAYFRSIPKGSDVPLIE